MSTPILVLNLVITIAFILVMILKFKQNPVIAMFVGALYMGIGSGLGMPETVSSIVAGFGGTMQGIGITVGFGIILGQLVAETGGVQSIAKGMVKAFGVKHTDKAMGLTGFIVSIPVFYDVGYVVLMPIAKALARANKKQIAFYVSALVAGLGISHTFIPPTPGPLTGAELLGVEVGSMIAWGIIVGLPTFLISTFIYNKFFLSRSSFWTDSCLDPDAVRHEEEIKKLEAEHIKDEKNLPSFWFAMLPIFLPIVMILMGTFSQMILGKGNVPSWIRFLSDKNMAMFAGVIASMLLCIGRLSFAQMEKGVNDALSQAGTVLLITGMGGGLGKILADVGIGKALVTMLQTVNISPLLFAWLVAALIKAAQGSGTVAMITTAGLIAPTMASINVAPVIMALATFSGTLATAHVNDSGFWITAKIGGLSTQGGLKTYTLTCFIVSIVSLVFLLVLNMFVK